MRKKLLLSLLAAVCCMSMWAQTTGPADNEIWYTSTDETIDFSTIGTVISNEKPDGKDYFVATFDDDVTEIPEDASWENTSLLKLTSITLPASVETIGNYAFEECTNLKSVTFAEGSKLSTLGEEVFAYSAITEIELPAGITSIPARSFVFCLDLESVTFAGKITEIGQYAFLDCTSLDFVVPATVTTIGEDAFGYDEEIFEIEEVPLRVPEAVLSFADGYSTTIGSEAFRGAYFSTIILSEGMTEIGYASFMSCEYLKSIVIPKSMKTIGDYAFMNCINLPSVTIPEGVTSIGTQAFSFCSNLKEVTMLCTAPPTVNDYDAWSDISADAVLVVPSGCKSAYETAGWDAWFTIKEGEPLNVTEVGWASFYTGVALDIPSCAKVYYASAASGSTLTLTEITGTIPAETAVIVQIPAGTLFPVSESTPEAITGNLLRGTLTNTPRTEAVYVLSPASSKESPVFQNYTGTTLGAGKAYILKSDLDPAASNMLRFVFGEATHIEAVSTDDANADAPMYNMAGQRVSDDYRGLVIKNGRKVMIR